MRKHLQALAPVDLHVTHVGCVRISHSTKEIDTIFFDNFFFCVLCLFLGWLQCKNSTKMKKKEKKAIYKLLINTDLTSCRVR